MNRLEIIHLRLTGDAPAALGDLIREFPASAGGDRIKVSVYRREGLATDLAVHIRRPAGPAAGEPCELALHLAAALRVYGLVEHTLWDELDS